MFWPYLILPISFGMQAVRLVFWRFGRRPDVGGRCTRAGVIALFASVDISALLFGSFLILLILGVPIGHALAPRH